MPQLEHIAALLGLMCVTLTVYQHVFCWPTGLAMVVLYFFVFYDAQLYSDMLLQGIYVPLQLYGWYAWCRGGPQGTELHVHRLPVKHAWGWAVVCGVSTAGLGAVTLQYRAAFPFLDAFTTIASLIAQWLMGRKILESWLVWIAVDIVSIGIYSAKELYFTAVLYTLFLLLAGWGFVQWSKTSPVSVAA
ncbi:MAG: nicotinamide riboside transporter PnuC [Pirellulaceae bacterium]